MLFWISRARAIGRDVDIEAPHVGVVRGDGDAAVGGEPGEDQGFYFQMAEQHLERSHVEGGMQRLEDEIVFAVWKQGTHKFCTFGLKTAAHEHFLFAAPIAEVVVYVEDGDAGLTRTLFEFHECIAHFQCAL